MTPLSPFALKFAARLTKVGFVPSPSVQQQIQGMQQEQAAAGQPPVDPAAAAGMPPEGAPVDPAMAGAPVDPAAAGAPPADPAAAGGAVDPATGQPMPALTLDDVAAMLEQLAQMIQQIPQQMAAMAPAGGEQKKKSPAERMDAIEQQLAQLTGGGAPAGAPPADPAAAGGAPAPAPAPAPAA